MIPLVDLKAQLKSIRGEIDAAISDVLDSCQFTLGPEVERFEETFAAYLGVEHVVAVNSGTSALHLALLVNDISQGDEVVTTPLTFVATTAAIRYCGARPVFVDVEPTFYTLDPDKIEGAVNKKTKAIIPVHLHGQACDMARIETIAGTLGLRVIEDAAQAHGATHAGKNLGSIGNVGCFSFYPGKNLGAYGEGGALVTNDPDLAKRARMLRDWGAEKKYIHLLNGYNYRMEAIQAAVLNVKMTYLQKWTTLRVKIARAYTQALSSCETFILPSERPNSNHVFHVYSIQHKHRDIVAQELMKRNIGSGIHYPFPIHLLPAYSDLNYGQGSFPIAERLSRNFLSLPIYPELDKKSQQYIIQTMIDINNRDLTWNKVS